MKYHIHVHDLVTFGGLGVHTHQWRYPEFKDKIDRYRDAAPLTEAMIYDLAKNSEHLLVQSLAGYNI